MNMNDVQFAHLPPQHVDKIRRLEQELAVSLGASVILLAYEPRSGEDAQRLSQSVQSRLRMLK
ncbi:hypothetical protein GCM10025857_16950 [Alicyclobacillus contaminans]|uniref:hypothetical protein n=1 Tax=Alicyclobacillus contaminans TaxID=392016 RepID=UPI0003FDA0AD|nr:hypothetical protein [Alicyclobacillus contaminans]GMA50338.1 hypothetical protein GCM10025857_16950 [Alicyclobacillus contaminans]